MDEARWRKSLVSRCRLTCSATLTLRVRFADGRSDSRTTRLPEPAATDGALLEAATALLGRVTSGDRPLRTVSVSCAGLLSAGWDLNREGTEDGDYWPVPSGEYTATLRIGATTVRKQFTIRAE